MTISIGSIQVFPSWKNEDEFEQFITDLFNKIEDTYSYSRFGRKGQSQFGIDILSIEKETAIQCKVRDITIGNHSHLQKNLIDCLQDDFCNFQKYNKSIGSKIKRFIYASTFLPDVKIETVCNRLSSKHITVEYWSRKRILDASGIEDTFESHLDLYDVLRSIKQRLPTSFPAQYVQDISKPLINYLFDHFSQLFNQILVVPNHTWICQYPFKCQSSFSPYYQSYTIFTDNEELCDLFESLTIENDTITLENKKFLKDVSEPESKLGYIVEKLNDNLIFYINHYSKRRSIDIRFKQSKPSIDLKDPYYKLDFGKALVSLSNESQATDALLQKAFLHFEFGNYLESAKLYEQVAIISDEKQLFVQFYLAKYNLSLLKVFIRLQYFQNPVASELEKRLLGIDTNAIFYQIKSDDNEKLISWVENFDFYNSARRKVSNLTSKIRDVYYSQLKGELSINTYIDELLNEYVQFLNFLLKNHIPFTRFTEFTEITDEFMEGVFASHAISDRQTSKLEAFDDILLTLMLFYSTPGKIFRFCNRYNLKEIHYTETSSEEGAFCTLIETLLTSHSTIKSDFERVCEEGNRNFWMRYNTIFSNALVLAGLADLPAEKTDLISNNLLSFLNAEDFIRSESVKHIVFYIKRKAEHIDRATLYGFLKLFLTERKYHEEQSIRDIIHVIYDKYGSFLFDPEDLEFLINVTFRSECSICQRIHETETIVTLYQALQDNEQKALISQETISYLNGSFDLDLFHNASVGGILEYDNELFDQFIEAAMPTSDSRSMRSIFSGIEDNRYLLVNKLNELCLLFDIDTSDKKYDCFKAIDPYYQWLFDMDGFDYELFDPNWLTDYYSPLFLKEFSKHLKIINSLTEYIEKTQNQHLTMLYLKIINLQNILNYE
jgi:hypothetical protein